MLWWENALSKRQASWATFGVSGTSGEETDRLSVNREAMVQTCCGIRYALIRVCYLCKQAVSLSNPRSMYAETPFLRATGSGPNVTSLQFL